jgi:hypothetical protein
MSFLLGKARRAGKENFVRETKETEEDVIGQFEEGRSEVKAKHGSNAIAHF